MGAPSAEIKKVSLPKVREKGEVGESIKIWMILIKIDKTVMMFFFIGKY